MGAPFRGVGVSARDELAVAASASEGRPTGVGDESDKRDERGDHEERRPAGAMLAKYGRHLASM